MKPQRVYYTDETPNSPKVTRDSIIAFGSGLAVVIIFCLIMTLAYYAENIDNVLNTAAMWLFNSPVATIILFVLLSLLVGYLTVWFVKKRIG